MNMHDDHNQRDLIGISWANSGMHTKDSLAQVSYRVNVPPIRHSVDDLSKEIIRGWEKGRVPLFLYGAFGTPILIDQYQAARSAIDDWKKRNPLHSYGGAPIESLLNRSCPPTRPEQARFFSDLKKWDDGKVWDLFCTKFLFQWVTRFLKQRKDRTESDKYYGIVIDSFKKRTPMSMAYPDIVVLTTNFDGAIPDILNQSSSPDCRVLESADRIRDLTRMGTLPSILQVPHVITLRGDVYHALCEHPLCSMQGKTVTAYDALADALRVLGDPSSNAEIYKVVNGIMTCPECRNRRLLTISFPGLEIKEQEIEALMTSVWALYGTRISTICTVGFSGNSDREVVRYLSLFAEKQGCCWFDFGKDISNTSSHTSTPIDQLKGKLHGATAVRECAARKLRDKFIIVDGKGAQYILPAIQDQLETTRKELGEPNKPRTKQSATRNTDIMDDLLWIAHESDHAEVVYRTVGDASAIIKLRKSLPSYLAASIEKLSSAKSKMINLQETSQLALKNYWWHPGVSGKQDMALHSRLHHSLGVLRITDAWFNRLMMLRPKDGRKSTRRRHTGDMHKCVSYAALLHDIGHIPFSHLIEEAFQELHWSLDGRTSYTHEKLTELRLKSCLGNDADRASMIQDIIEGSCGLHWLDAMINSPFDADKIDYVFRDQHWIGLGGRTGQHFQWLGDFLSDQEVTPQGQILLHRKSAVAAYKILSERAYLYDTLYHAPKVRVMERITRYILVSYFTLGVSSSVTKRLAKHLAIRSTNNTELSIDEFSLCRALWDDTENVQSPPRAETLAASFIDSLEAHYGNDKGNSLMNLGSLKLAYSIASVYQMIDDDFPLCKKYRTATYNERDLIRQAEIPSVKDYSEFLEKHLKLSHFRKMTELKIIAEIGAWAVDAIPVHARKDGTGVVELSQPHPKHLVDLIELCHLILDPFFAKKDNREESAVSNGKWLDRIFAEHYIGGPYIIRCNKFRGHVHNVEDWLKSARETLEKIGRQLSYEHPGRFLLDVTGPLKVRSYSAKRVIHSHDNSPNVCEQFWVPNGDPQNWSSSSPAEVPLSRVDFQASIPQAYKIRVLLIDPSKSTDGRGVLLDRFKLACKEHQIPLIEEVFSEKD